MITFHFWLVLSITITKKTAIDYDWRLRLPHATNMGVGRIFFRGDQGWIFFEGAKDFSRGGYDEISIYLLETQKRSHLL